MTGGAPRPPCGNCPTAAPPLCPCGCWANATVDTSTSKTTKNVVLICLILYFVLSRICIIHRAQSGSPVIRKRVEAEPCRTALHKKFAIGGWISVVLERYGEILVASLRRH